MTVVKIDISPEQDEFIRRAVETGRFGSAAEVVQDALALWIERERDREEILAAIDEAEASLACGEGVVLTKENLQGFIDDVKRRGRARTAKATKAKTR